MYRLTVSSHVLIQNVTLWIMEAGVSQDKYTFLINYIGSVIKIRIAVKIS